MIFDVSIRPAPDKPMSGEESTAAAAAHVLRGESLLSKQRGRLKFDSNATAITKALITFSYVLLASTNIACM